MESSSTGGDAAAAQLAEAESLRSRLADGLRLPSLFHVVLGASVAVQMTTAALGIAAQTGSGLVVALVGCAQFAAVGLLLSWRFRALNGVWVGGLLTRSVLGSTWAGSLAYAVPFAFAVWLAMTGLGWLAVLMSLVGGAAYALVARRWWAAYHRDPAGHAEGSSRTALALAVVSAVGGLVVLLGLALGR